SGSCISAIFVSKALSPSAFSGRGPRCADAFISWTYSFIAARSSSVNPLNFLFVAAVLLADFCVSFFGLIEPPLGWRLIGGEARFPSRERGEARRPRAVPARGRPLGYPLS